MDRMYKEEWLPRMRFILQTKENINDLDVVFILVLIAMFFNTMKMK